MSLVTTDLLKEYLPELTGTGANTELQNLLDRAESAIARWLGFPIPDGSNTATIAVSTYTLYVDEYWRDDRTVLPLPIKPVVTISSVHSDPDRNYGSDTEVGSTEYEIDKLNGLLIIKPDVSTVGFSKGFRSNKVVGTFGFTLFHKDVVHAVCVYSSHLHRAKSNQGKKSTSIRNSTVTFLPNTIPPEVKEILYPYRSTAVIL